MTAELVRVDNVSKVYYQAGLLRQRARSMVAVRNVSFSIAANTVLGLVGESGCGKSTLARAVAWLDPPTSGRVVVSGIDPGLRERSQMALFRRTVQIVFQDPYSSLNPRQCIGESVAEGLRNQGVPRDRRRREVARLLDMVGISPNRASERPHRFSGGQRQRIVIARALAVQPRFLILDEPVSSLDVSIQAQIVNLLVDLKRELSLTYLFISHDLNLIAYLSDEIAVMRDGTIIEQAPAEQLIAAPVHQYTRALFADAPVLPEPRSRSS
ncbi:MAG: ABC transporter ATP-binding protein [Spirochaetaceae bacterium]|nr:MAG: ABC transporter ATP-binding protein [Spirochaetaceae bacterium]